MSATKDCVGCKKTIPTAAAACVYCGTRQPLQEFRLTAMLASMSPDSLDGPAVPNPDGQAAASEPEGLPAGGRAVARANFDPPSEESLPGYDNSLARARRKSSTHSSQTANTVVGLNEAALAAVAAADALEAAAASALEPNAAPNVFTLRPTAMMGAVSGGDDISDSITPAAVAAVPRALPRPAPATAAPAATDEPLRWPAVARAVMVAAGAVLCIVFGMSASLLPALGGAQLILAMYYLTGGILLVGGGLLPLPARLRAVFAAVVGAIPLFVAAPQVRLEGWRGLIAALVFLLLPGALLLRARVTGSRLARALVGLGVALAILLYLIPDEGVMPLRAALSLVSSGSLGGIFAALLLVAPLGLALATLTAFAGSDSSGFGNLWAVLILLTASGAIIFIGMEQKEVSLVHLGVGLLAAGSAGAVGVSQLLDLDSQTA